MKYSSITLFALIFSLASYITVAQAPACPIDNLEVEVDTCTSDSTYILNVNLEYQVADDSFELYIDNELYGIFQFHELPLRIEDAQSGGGSHDQIKVCHADVPNCCRVESAELPDCLADPGCELEELHLNVHDCVNDSFMVSLDFMYSDTGQSGFTLRIDGEVYGLYNYSDLPLDIGPLADEGDDIEVEVFDNDDPDCDEEDEIEEPICGGPDCELEDLELQSVNCAADTFYIEINFDIENPGANGFDVAVNGADSGNYDYSALPLVLGPFIDDGRDWDVQLSDSDDPDCLETETLEAEETDCQVLTGCKIDKLQLEIIECTTDSTYELWVDFDHDNTGDSFNLYANGSLLGAYAYDSLPIIVDFPSDGKKWDHVVACDNDNQFCCKHGIVRVPDCIDIGECKLAALHLSPLDCSNDTFSLEVWFQHFSASNAGFSLEVDGDHYGDYDYGNLPVNIGPFVDDGNEITVRVRDLEEPECTLLESTDDFDCTGPDSLTCDIDNVSVFVGDCTSDETYTITVSFDYNEVSDSFNLFAQPNTYLGRFAYDDLPVTIDDFPSNGGKFDHVRVCNQGPPNCCKVGKFLVPPCVDIRPRNINAKDRIQLFPIPTNNRMFVDVPKDLKILRAYMLVPGSGQVDLHLSRGKNGIDLSGYEPGYYFMVIETDEGRIVKQLIISD